MRRRHPDNLDLVAHRRQGGHPLLDAPGAGWDTERLLEGMIPPRCPLVLVVGGDDDLHPDPFLAGLVLDGLRHAYFAI